MRTRASRLFHTVVVVGASLGCGDRSSLVTLSSDRDASTRRADGSAPDGGRGDAGARDARESDSSEGDSGPRDLCDCVQPGMFRCRACASGRTPIQGRCAFDDGVACFCDETIAIAGPSDCAHPEQLVCAQAPDLGVQMLLDAGPGMAPILSGPFGNWFDFAQCSCDPTLPTTASQCTCESCGLACLFVPPCLPGTAGWTREQVRYDCDCAPPPIPIR